MDLAKWADTVLFVFKSGKIMHINSVIRASITVNPLNRNEEGVLIDYMERHDLIQGAPDRFNQWEYVITPNGYQIVASGGWLKHLQDQKEAEDEVTNLIKQNESFQNRITVINTRINFGLLIIGFIALIVTGYGVYLTNKTSTLELLLTKERKQKDSLLKVTTDLSHSLENEGKKIQQLGLKIDSLLKVK